MMKWSSWGPEIESCWKLLKLKLTTLTRLTSQSELSSWPQKALIFWTLSDLEVGQDSCVPIEGLQTQRRRLCSATLWGSNWPQMFAYLVSCVPFLEYLPFSKMIYWHTWLLPSGHKHTASACGTFPFVNSAALEYDHPIGGEFCSVCYHLLIHPSLSSMFW